MRLVDRFIQRVYGQDGEHWTPYLTRVFLTPRTRWGGLYLHIFHRGDQDRHVHDHPWTFWTFPLNSYLEVVRHLQQGTMLVGCVERFKWHRRSAEHAHRVMGPARKGQRKIVTLVWHGPKERSWGFWVDDAWVHWRDYIYPPDGANSSVIWGSTNPELTKLLEAAAAHTMTPREIWMQRVSFVYGQMMDSNSSVNEGGDVERRAEETYGPCPEE